MGLKNCRGEGRVHASHLNSYFFLHKQLISLENAHFMCVISFSDNIECWLRESHCPLEVISPAVETLQKLCHASAHVPEEAQVWLKICLKIACFTRRGAVSWRQLLSPVCRLISSRNKEDLTPATWVFSAQLSYLLYCSCGGEYPVAKDRLVRNLSSEGFPCPSFPRICLLSKFTEFLKETCCCAFMIAAISQAWSSLKL